MTRRDRLSLGSRVEVVQLGQSHFAGTTAQKHTAPEVLLGPECLGAPRQPEAVSERRSGRQLQSRSTNERSRRVDGADAFLAPVVPGQTRFGVVRSPSSLQMFVPALRTPPLPCGVREEEVKTLLRGACSPDGWLDQQLAVINPKNRESSS